MVFGRHQLARAARGASGPARPCPRRPVARPTATRPRSPSRVASTTPRSSGSITLWEGHAHTASRLPRPSAGPTWGTAPDVGDVPPAPPSDHAEHRADVPDVTSATAHGCVAGLRAGRLRGELPGHPVRRREPPARRIPAHRRPVRRRSGGAARPDLRPARASEPDQGQPLARALARRLRGLHLVRVPAHRRRGRDLRLLRDGPRGPRRPRSRHPNPGAPAASGRRASSPSRAWGC